MAKRTSAKKSDAKITETKKTRSRKTTEAVKPKAEPETAVEVAEPRQIEAVKMGDTKIGMSTLNAMNKVTGQLIGLVYSLESRVAALEDKKG